MSCFCASCQLSGCSVRFTPEHAEQLLVLQHDGSFHQILKVGIDPRSDTGILSHPLLSQDVDVVSHLDRKVVNR